MAATKLELMQQGPFPNQIDPWVEKGHYFHQLHGQMIGNLLKRIQKLAHPQGYLVGREASLQISQSQPDLLINRVVDKGPAQSRDYEKVVASLNVEAGIAFENGVELELDRLFIKSLATGRLVTVIELISPSNKNDDDKIMRYQSRRQDLLNNAVDVVEIDLTRSVKHLIDDRIAKNHPYHIAIHLYDRLSRFLGIRLEERLKSFALPLEDTVLVVELDNAYRESYDDLLMAEHMLNEKHYEAENLPFPSTLTDTEREALLESLSQWKEAIK